MHRQNQEALATGANSDEWSWGLRSGVWPSLEQSSTESFLEQRRAKRPREEEDQNPRPKKMAPYTFFSTFLDEEQSPASPTITFDDEDGLNEDHSFTFSEWPLNPF